MRLKLRFYVCVLESREGAFPFPEVTTADLFAAVRSSISDAFGDIALAQVVRALAVRYYSPASRVCVVRGPAPLPGTSTAGRRARQARERAAAAPPPSSSDATSTSGLLLLPAVPHAPPGGYVRSALSLVKAVRKLPASLRVLHVSGSVRTVARAAQRLHTVLLAQRGVGGDGGAAAGAAAAVVAAAAAAAGAAGSSKAPHSAASEARAIQAALLRD
jgi:RNase P/RNase MRP subunit POP5